MTGSSDIPRLGLQWLSKRWFLTIGALTLLQAAVFWAVSPWPATPDLPPRTEARPLAVAGVTGGLPEDWYWLMNPGLLLMPSPPGFSGAAWLRTAPSELAFEPLTVQAHPLPFQPVSSLGPVADLLPRTGAGPTDRWGVPASVAPLMAVGSMPWPASPRVWVVSGLEGWRPATEIQLPDLPSGAIPRPAVLRLRLNREGELAYPPVLWEGTGVAACDEAALRGVASLHFEPVETGAAPGRESAPEPVGLVALEWAVAGGAAGGVKGERR